MATDPRKPKRLADHEATYVGMPAICKRLGYSNAYVRSLLCSHEIPSYRIGGLIRVRLDELRDVARPRSDQTLRSRSQARRHRRAGGVMTDDRDRDPTRTTIPRRSDVCSPYAGSPTNGRPLEK